MHAHMHAHMHTQTHDTKIKVLPSYPVCKAGVSVKLIADKLTVYSLTVSLVWTPEILVSRAIGFMLFLQGVQSTLRNIFTWLTSARHCLISGVGSTLSFANMISGLCLWHSVSPEVFAHELSESRVCLQVCLPSSQFAVWKKAHSFVSGSFLHM